MTRVRELRWLLAYMVILTIGSVVLTASSGAWPDAARAAFLAAYLGFAVSLLLLGRERTRR